MKLKAIREAEIIENTLMHFPDEISQEIHDYVIEDVLQESRYLFVKQNGNLKRGYCTYCKKTQDADGLKHKEEYKCVHCKSDCHVQFVNYSRTKMIDKAYFVYYGKSELNDEAMIARGFNVQMDYTDGYENVVPEYETIAYYLFEKDNSVMVKLDSWRERLELRKSVFSLFAEYTAFGQPSVKIQDVCKDSIKKAVKGTHFQYSVWDDRRTMTYDDFVRYFATYTKFPQIEYLSKLGFKDFVEMKVYDVSFERVINWRGKTLEKVFRLPKEHLNKVIEMQTSINLEVLKIIQENIREKMALSIDEILDLRTGYVYGSSWNRFKEISKETSIRKTYNYFKKQSKVSGYRNVGETMRMFQDYREGCSELGVIPGENIAAFPSNLREAHDNVFAQIHYRENKELDEQIKEQLKDLSKYEFNRNGLFIRPFETTAEIIEEGKRLVHCVGQYAERYANGETILLAIRKVSDPKEPYYTMEIKDGKVRQYYGYKNNQYKGKSQEVIELVKMFKKIKLNNERDVVA